MGVSMNIREMPYQQRPEPGETVTHCEHLVGARAWDWLLLETPWSFQRPDGSVGETRWIVFCAACFAQLRESPDPEAVVQLIGGDSVWEHGQLSNGASPPGTSAA